MEVQHNNDRAAKLARLGELQKATERIDPKYLAKERYLMTTKWFGYRFLSPHAATREFAIVYEKQFKQVFKQNIDIEQAKHVSGFSKDKFREGGRAYTQMFLARQRADETGMTYAAYIGASLKFGMRRKRKYIPQPNQLHHSGKGHEIWLKVREQAELQSSDAGGESVNGHCAYRIETFQDLPAQLAHRSHIVDKVARSKGYKWRHMGQYALERHQVPAKCFKHTMSKELFFDQCKSLLAQRDDFKKEPMPSYFEPDLWQSCFGVPGARDENAEPCCGCPQAASCKKMAELVTQVVFKSTGSETPVQDKKRSEACERKRKQRRKEKDAAIKSAAATLSSTLAGG